MKISVVQLKSYPGDISGNITHHVRMINRLVKQKVEVIIFPELSLTGYEPELADSLAIKIDDHRLDAFQLLTNQHHTVIGVGIPVKSESSPHISMIIFRPNHPREVYHKQFLHSDEYPFFSAGNNEFSFIHHQSNIAPAICYEISVDAHIEKAKENGAEIYIASVAKFVNGIDAAQQRLSMLARQYKLTVIMANGIGMADGAICGGRSAVWNTQGELVAQLSGTEEGFLIFDTETGTIFRS